MRISSHESSILCLLIIISVNNYGLYDVSNKRQRREPFSKFS